MTTINLIHLGAKTTVEVSRNYSTEDHSMLIPHAGLTGPQTVLLDAELALLGLADDMDPEDAWEFEEAGIRAHLRDTMDGHLDDCTPEERDWLLRQHNAAPPLSDAQVAGLARLQAVALNRLNA